MNNNAIKFAELENADLIIDAIYEGGKNGNTSDDPLAKLLKVNNQGGFRYIGNINKGEIKIVILYSSMDDADWPDSLDNETGIFYYYGDNKKPGTELHSTPRKGNLLLRMIFEKTHNGYRNQVPVVFVFTKAGKGRDVVFRGVAVPGASSVSSTDDLVAVWKTYSGSRFQNYRALFTILDIAKVERRWILDILNGSPLSINCPPQWKLWVHGGSALPLKALKVRDHRNKLEQLPQNKVGKELLLTIRNHYKENPYSFEKFAAELLKIADKNITTIEITRPRKDGGRDAVGQYKLQMGHEGIDIDFAMEAKCYDFSNSVGIKEISRLISRLRHRQFGVLVTTSYVGEQAYKEVREDRHPILIISGKDIVDILLLKGINTKVSLESYLEALK